MLYIVGTPIGNLDDLSYRAARTILQSDLVLAEDTRSTHHLISRAQSLFNLSPKPDQKIISYYKEKEFEKLPQIIDELEVGLSVCLVSESGMPLISDPGYLLVKTAIARKIPFEVIPGPTAATTALVYSGFRPETYMFLGYLPKKDSHLTQLFNLMSQMNDLTPGMPFIFFESPHRIQKTLSLLDALLPQAQLSICRELTKTFEEVTRGKAAQLANRKYKGELTVVLVL